MMRPLGRTHRRGSHIRCHYYHNQIVKERILSRPDDGAAGCQFDREVLRRKTLRGTNSQSNFTLRTPPRQQRNSEYSRAPDSCQRPKRKNSRFPSAAPKSPREPQRTPLPNCPARDWVYYIGHQTEGKPEETHILNLWPAGSTRHTQPPDNNALSGGYLPV